MGESKRKIYFRADASAQIGYGHFIRSLALADMLKNDFDCVFFTQSPSEYQKMEVEKVCQLIDLPSDDTKFILFLSYLKGDEIVVLDNYFFSSSYQKRIKDKGCCLVCIDDMHDKHYFADLIINQGLGYSSSDYSCEEYTRFAIGLEYQLLRKPFLEAYKIKGYQKQEGIRVLIAFGGSDTFDLTSKVISAVCEIDNVHNIVAVVGDSYSSDSKIENSKVEYKKNLSAFELVSAFKNTDCAILPASTMLNEAISCGTYVISGYYIDNQEHDYYMFLQNRLISGVGDFLDSDVIDKILFWLDKIHKREGINITSDIPKRFVNLFKKL